MGQTFHTSHHEGIFDLSVYPARFDIGALTGVLDPSNRGLHWGQASCSRLSCFCSSKHFKAMLKEPM